MDRPIDFSRKRHMLCGHCGDQHRVSPEWIHSWQRGNERCPGCGITCEHEDRARPTVDPDDPALDDGAVPQLFWYHTSTHSDWPSTSFDPASDLTDQEKRMMGGAHRVAAWAQRQRAKALHVGTYEAAIHNMLRRIEDQTDAGSQFHLYQVRLRPSAVVREDWIVDPVDFVGDVPLDEVCPPGVDVTRYVNHHEDPSRLSLALGRDAIASVEQVTVPIPGAGDADWQEKAVSALDEAAGMPHPPAPTLGRMQLFQPSPQAEAARELADELAHRLPPDLHDRISSAARFADGTDPTTWARRVSGLVDLVEHPERALTALEAVPVRAL